MITLENVTKRYNTAAVAVNSLSLEIRKGEVMGLIGPSGSGKTTTLKMINRLIEPSGGRIFVDGTNILRQNPIELRRSIGYVIQHIGLFPHYSIRQNIEVIPRLLNWPDEKIKKRCRFLLELVELNDESIMHKKPSELSGGQQQRIGLARALAADPPIVLLDEPFGALDPITRGDVRTQFKNLQQKLQKTMVMVTHDTAEAFELCDRLALLKDGAFQQIGPPADLLFKPANDFCTSFFNSNRFQLEMQTITLQQCLEYMEPVKSDAPTIQFDTQTSFNHVIQHIERLDQNTTTLSPSNGPLKGTVFEAGSLMQGFEKAKSALRAKYRPNKKHTA